MYEVPDVPAQSPAGETSWLPRHNPLVLSDAALLNNHVFGFATDDPRGQAFSMLRSRVLRYVDQNQARLIAVTSANPGEGKSFVALNLAAALSRIHPTWLVDTDLRDPSISNRLGFRPNYGVDAFLSDGTPFVPVQCAAASDALNLVAIRHACIDSAKMLASPRASELFAQLRERAGNAVVLVDTPPVLAGDDMMILAPHFDAIIFVVEEGRTLRADLQESLRILAPTPILGTVLNRTLTPSKAHYYGRYPVAPISPPQSPPNSAAQSTLAKKTKAPTISRGRLHNYSREMSRLAGRAAKSIDKALANPLGFASKPKTKIDQDLP